MSHDHTPGCGCDHHVFTTPVGGGLRVVPRAPFRARLGSDRAWLDVEHDSPDGPRRARVRADGEGRFSWELGDATPALEDVLDVFEGPALEGWWIDAPFITFPFPEGFALHSVPAGASSPFDLVGPCGTLIYAQQPARVPALDGMLAPGQREARRGASWIEVEYEHGGGRWWQRHQLADPGLVFTAQALADHVDEARRALIALLERARAPEA